MLQENVTNKVQIFVRIIIIVITLCDVKQSAAAKVVRALVEQKQKCRNRAYQSNAERPEIPSTLFQALQNGQRYSLSCEGCGLLRDPEKMSMYGLWTGIASGRVRSACSGLSRSGRRWSAMLSPNEGGEPPGEGGSTANPDDWGDQSDVSG